MGPNLSSTALQRQDLVNEIYDKTIAAAMTTAYTHTQNIDLPALLTVAIAVQDDCTLNDYDDTQDFEDWLQTSPMVGDRTMADRLLSEPHLVTATLGPSSLRAAIERLSYKDLLSINDVSPEDQGVFNVRVRGNLITKAVSRVLEYSLRHDSFSPTLSVNLPLTEAATTHYKRAFDWSRQTPDSTLIPRQVKPLDSFPRQKMAMAAVEALQELTSIYTGDNKDLLKAIRLQDMISMPGPEGAGPSDPFELFTEDERLDFIASKLAGDSVPEQALMGLRGMDEHWTGVASNKEMYLAAQSFEAGSKVFTAKLKLEVKEGYRSILRVLYVTFDDPEPFSPQDAGRVISQGVRLSPQLADKLCDAATVHNLIESGQILTSVVIE